MQDVSVWEKNLIDEKPVEIVKINTETMSLAEWLDVQRETSDNGVPQVPVWGPALFNMSVSDMGSGIKCTLSKLVGDTKLCGLADMLERR